MARLVEGTAVAVDIQADGEERGTKHEKDFYFNAFVVGCDLGVCRGLYAA